MIQYSNPPMAASEGKWARRVVCARYLKDSAAERQAQSGRKQQIIALEIERRVADVAIAKSHLPSQRVFQLRRRRGVEVNSVITGRAQIWKESELFSKGRPRAELRAQ